MKKLVPLMLLLVLLASCLVGCKEDPIEVLVEVPIENVFYTVKFDTLEGSAVPSQKVLEGMTAVEPKSPTKDGWTFSHWKLNGKTYDFTTPVTSDLTLKASYTSDEDVNTTKIEARKIYNIVNIFVNKTNLTEITTAIIDNSTFKDNTQNAGDLVIEALNVGSKQEKRYIPKAGEKNNLITLGEVYNSDNYTMTIKGDSITGNSSGISINDGNATYEINIEELKLTVTYKKNNITTITTGDSVDCTAIFKDVKIVWEEKTVDEVSCVEGSVEMTIGTSGNNTQNVKMTFIKMYGELYSANYKGQDIKF